MAEKRKSLLEIVLMPLVLTIVGTVGTYLVTHQRQLAIEAQAAVDRERADIAALASRQLKILELFADKIVSDEDDEQMLAILSTLALDPELAAKLLPTFSIKAAERDADFQRQVSIIMEGIVLARLTPDTPLDAIEGQWRLRRSDQLGQSFDNFMTIHISPPDQILVEGDTWSGTGKLNGRKGYYDWHFADGRSGRTEVFLDSSGMLFGWVNGGNLNWTYWATQKTWD